MTNSTISKIVRPVLRPGSTVPDFVVVADAADDVWRQEKNGKPGYARFRVYEVAAMNDRNGRLLFYRAGYMSSDDHVEKIDDADVMVDGTVKWDGCTDFQFRDDVMMHACDADELDILTTAIRLGYDLAFKLTGGGDD